MKNPVMTASGTFGYGVEFADFVNLEEIGGIIVKGTTLHAREGNDYPRMVETASGMLNCVGLQNKGVDYFCEHIYPEIKDIKTNMIVNVSGFRDFAFDALCVQPDALHLGQAVNIARFQASDVLQVLAHRGQILGGDVLHPFLEQCKQRFKLAFGQHYSSPSCGDCVGDRDEIN